MPDIFYLLSKWWKQLFIVVTVSLLAAGVIIFLQPRQYLSVATAVPANVLSTDKAKIFNENIESLYSNLGSPDDLDMIVGTAQLDTVYLAVTDQFNLFDHYKVSGRIKAAHLLKKYSHVAKTGYGELQAKVWDTDKELAPQLANAIIAKLETIHSKLQNENNRLALQSLQGAIKDIQTNVDTIKNGPTTEQSGSNNIRRKVLLDQLEEYQKLSAEYQLSINSGSQVLLIVEKARAAIRPDKPEWLKIMIAVAVLSFLFAFLVALVLEKRKTIAE